MSVLTSWVTRQDVESGHRSVAGVRTEQERALRGPAVVGKSTGRRSDCPIGDHLKEIDFFFPKLNFVSFLIHPRDLNCSVWSPLPIKLRKQHLGAFAEAGGPSKGAHPIVCFPSSRVTEALLGPSGV